MIADSDLYSTHKKVMRYHLWNCSSAMSSDPKISLLFCCPNLASKIKFGQLINCSLCLVY